MRDNGEPANLIELLRQRTAEHADQRAYLFLNDGEEEGAELTWGQLDTRARAIGALLQSSGAEGQRALLLFPPGLDFVTAFFGCLYGGAIAVPAYPPASRRHLPRLQAVVRDAEPTVVLTTVATLPKIRNAVAELPELAQVRWLTSDGVSEEVGATWNDPKPSRETLAFLQYTSGSTASPKGVMVSHGNLMHNEEVIRQATGHDEQTVFAGWLPLYHDMGLIGNVLQPLYLGIPCILMSPVAFLQKPVRWLRAIGRYGATTSGGPNFAYELCLRKISAEQRADLDLSSWNVAFSGAEPVRVETLERFAAAFASCGLRPEALYPCYGMAETTLMISGGDRRHPPRIESVDAAALEENRVVSIDSVSTDSGDARRNSARRLVGCGQAGIDFEVVIVDPTTRGRCEADGVGEIWVAGPSVAQGYWQRPEATERDFHARLADGTGPFLRTGDLGFLRQSELFITGRRKDLIIIRGRNHYPQDLELTAERSHPALRAGCGAAVAVEMEGEERLVVIYEVERKSGVDPEIIGEAVRQAIAEEHQVQTWDVVLVRTSTIAKTSSGKIQRQANLRNYLSDELVVVGRSRAAGETTIEVLGAELEFSREAFLALAPSERQPGLESFLRGLFARFSRTPAAQLDVTKALTGLGLDSLTASEFKNEVEERLAVQLSLSVLLEGASLKDLGRDIGALLAAPANPPSLIKAVPLPDGQPLSHGQRALWYLDRLAPGNAAYNIAGAAEIHGEFDIPAFERCFQALVARHPMLRTTFGRVADEPLAQVHEHLDCDFITFDATPWDAEELERRMSREACRPFDLEKGPLLRVGVFSLGRDKRGDERHRIVLAVHHIGADFWSLGILVNELGTLYDAERRGAKRRGAERRGVEAEFPRLALTYADFVSWQERVLSGEEGEKLWAYWRQQLAEPALLDLPTDRPRPPIQTFVGDSRARAFDGSLSMALKGLSADREVTLYMTLMAAFQILLLRHSGHHDILVGSPTALRNVREFAPLVGYLVNPVVIRGDLSADPTFMEFLSRLRTTVLAAFTHQDYPFPLLVERLQPRHDPSRSPLFQAMFVWQQDRRAQSGLAGFALGEARAVVDVGPLRFESVSLPQTTCQFDLVLNMAEVEGRLTASLQYNTDLYDGSTVERLLAHLETLLEGVVATPGEHLAGLPLLTDEEECQLLAAGEPSPMAEEATCLHELVASQAARSPGEVAIIFGQRRVSYGQLDRAANRLAHHLRGLGVREETPVGVCTERCPEMILALLGILKAGGLYVPLDPDYPAERLAFIFDDSGLETLLIHRSTSKNLPSQQGRVVDLTRFELGEGFELGEEGKDEDSRRPPANKVSADNLAYVIYTSGSTGRPKGVAIAHRSAVAMVRWAGGVFSSEQLAGTLVSTSICFDLSVFEIFVPLARGGKLILAANAMELPELPAADEVTLINTVPSAMSELVAPGAVLPAALRTVNLAGEPLPRSLVEQIFRQPSVEKVFNLYGPSEDTTYSTFSSAMRDDPRPPSIGQPVAGTRLYLTDPRHQLVAKGVTGEILLAKAGLARGYFGRPALTAERFLPDPYSDHGGRVYRTGDLGRWRNDDSIEFLGRLDHQVKVRGFRIELGEIETTLRKNSAVREAVVLAREDRTGDHQLVAYVTGENGGNPESKELRRYLATSLPTFMVPQTVIILDALPFTPNGKIDRVALPSPELTHLAASADFVAPSTEVEELLAEIWREVLGIERVGIYDSFFDLGGHSLRATRVLSRVQDTFEVELTVRSLLESPTIAGMAEAIATKLMAEVDEETLASILAEM